MPFFAAKNIDKKVDKHPANSPYMHKIYFQNRISTRKTLTKI